MKGAALTVVAALAVFAIGGGTYASDIERLLTDTARQATGLPEARSARLADLDTARLTNDGTYERDAFGAGWADLDGDGCDTREEILARDLDRVVSPDGCDVDAGLLRDPYTGQAISYSDADGQAVHVDHLYPLSLAWHMGAKDWTEERRVQFANDPDNLLAVDGPANMSKGDSGPGEWVPINHTYACTYARKYVRVAAAYDLPVTRADLSALDDLLDTCTPNRK